MTNGINVSASIRLDTHRYLTGASSWANEIFLRRQALTRNSSGHASAQIDSTALFASMSEKVWD